MKLFVAPNGDDLNQGTITEPLKTFHGAQEFIRNLKSEADLPDGGLTVYFRSGEYETEGLKFTSRDSGSAEAPIEYAAYPGEVVTMLGGRRLKGWKNSHLGETDIHHFKLRSMDVFDYEGVELFCNGKAMTVARYPNAGWSYIWNVNPQTWFHEFFYMGERPAEWVDSPKARIRGYFFYDWKFMSLSISEVVPWNEEDQMSQLGAGGVMRINTDEFGYNYGFKAGMRYYVDNILSELDIPGEYYIDDAGTIYFWPIGDIEELEIYASIHTTFARFVGVHYVTFSNMDIRYYQGDVLKVNRCSHLWFKNLTISNSGGTGLIMQNSTFSGLVDSEIYGLGQGGISLSGGDRRVLHPSNLSASRNKIYNISRVTRTFTPAFLLQGVGIEVADNFVTDVPHVALELHGNDHMVVRNNFTRISFECGDCGAIMSSRSFTYYGNEISHNHFRDVASTAEYTALENVRAIFLDDHVSGFTITNNTFWNCSDAILIGGGRQNKVYNNTFEYCNTCVYLSKRPDQTECGEGGTWSKEFKLFDVKQPPWSKRYPDLAKIASLHKSDIMCSPVLNTVIGNRCPNSNHKFHNLKTSDILGWGTEFSDNDRSCDTHRKRKFAAFLMVMVLVLYVILRTCLFCCFGCCGFICRLPPFYGLRRRTRKLLGRDICGSKERDMKEV